ncbi:MAG: lytic transglycosylase domain-containing protein [Cyanobacteria bacterium K_DeepCast_35m_m2_023]|nr:lytic transglycosylase domain-containing protein [Cyanobacteria bacterium K_DeepCast_35m_m2_023]
MPVLVLLIGLALGGSASFTAPAWSNSVQAVAPMAAARVYPKVPPRPEQIASLLATIETELRASTTPATALPALGHQQQVIYRRLGRQPQLAQAVRALLPHRWQGVFDHHIGARRALQAMNRSGIKPTTLPAWRIVDPEPADALLAHYRKAEAATGIAWQVLAAVNLVETVMGRLDGVSIANAQGPMQILPSTWAERGIGQGNIRNPHDAIQAAARYLVRRGGLRDIRQGLWGYNNSDHYGRAVLHYAALLRSDPLAFRGLYHWQVHLMTSAGDLWLPSGTHNQSRLPVQQHIQRFPYAAPPDSL